MHTHIDTHTNTIECVTIYKLSLSIGNVKIRQHSTTRINLKDIVQSEISKTQKDKYCISPLIRGA